MKLDILFLDRPFDLKSKSEPQCFHDLNLDQMVASICTSKEKQELNSVYYHLLSTPEEIRYRQDIFRELERDILIEEIQKFILGMNALEEKKKQIEKLYALRQKQRYFVDMILFYIKVIQELEQYISVMCFNAEGFRQLQSYLKDFVRDERICECQKRGNDLIRELESIKYCVHIKGTLVEVKPFEEEEDYGELISHIFERFRQGEVKDYLYQKFAGGIQMNHIEEQILECVAKIYPQAFQKLKEFYDNYQDLFDQKIERFYREIPFYLSYRDYIQGQRNKGIKFCYPVINEVRNRVLVEQSCDIVLAEKMASENKKIVCNDFQYRPGENILLIQGPNQGGKTTFARMVGQLFYLSCLGCPVPGKYVELPLCDQVYTHFEKEENVNEKHSKLQEDLFRMKRILDQATEQSVIIMNETFSSTALYDAVYLAKRIIDRILNKNCLGVYVTFLDELCKYHNAIVSMVSCVTNDVERTRTYRIMRKEFNGCAYAQSIAEKYHLTYSCIKKRVKR